MANVNRHNAPAETPAFLAMEVAARALTKTLVKVEEGKAIESLLDRSVGLVSQADELTRLSAYRTIDVPQFKDFRDEFASGPGEGRAGQRRQEEEEALL